MNMRRNLLGLTIVLATLGCDLASTARGISVQLQASPLVATAGDTVTFTVTVVATSVTDIVINYADGSSDQDHAGGVSSAQVMFRHVYDNSGSYTARATVSDAVVGNRVVTQVITVNPKVDPVSARLRNN